MQNIYRYNSPLGEMTMAGEDNCLTGLWFDGQKFYASTLGNCYEEGYLPVFAQTIQWLDCYFSGEIPDFVPCIKLVGTSFQQMVWRILLSIPYGMTETYGGIARKVALLRGVPTISAQAIGGAVGHNPVSIIVPCHRVVGRNGHLTGYAGGIEKKFKLLKLEHVF